MTQEKAEYLTNRLQKKVKKEIFKTFSFLERYKRDKNNTFLTTYEIDDEKTLTGKFYIYYGDYRRDEPFDNVNGETSKIFINDEKISIWCHVESNDDDNLHNRIISAFTLARLMHFYKKYDRKLRKKDTK
ncbi:MULTISPECIES: hypothetical protein [unclassified Campylobacter]|uniref:hypothetical protein n=1 Tax=unclassified Campylobacter TaxID=2593542 RepID=UPI003D34D398